MEVPRHCWVEVAERVCATYICREGFRLPDTPRAEPGPWWGRREPQTFQVESMPAAVTQNQVVDLLLAGQTR